MLLSICSAHAETSSESRGKKTDSEKVTAKCHVVFLGGEEAIRTWYIYPEDISKLAGEVVVEKISTSRSDKKNIIFKVNECVLLRDKFINAKSKDLDELTEN